MVAKGKAYVESSEFAGRADEIHYDERKGQIILVGSEGSLASFHQQRSAGAQRNEIRSRKIWYWPKTGKVTVEEGYDAQFTK